MKIKKCYIDKNIILSNENKELLKSQNISCIEFDLDKNCINLHEIEYLLLHSFLPDEKLIKMNRCKYIGIRAHNTDYVNKEIANRYGIKVKGLNNQYGVNSVAEHTFALILGIAKNLINSHNNIISGKWKEGLQLNYELQGKTFGIIGYGKIGKRVEEIAKLFGLNVLIAGKENNIKENELPIDDVLRNSDIISIHISSKKENYKFFDKEKLQKMKKDSILINTSRGSVLDYEQLEAEVKKGKFIGVGLDVFPEEPLYESELFNLPNVICTPHLGYLTRESIEKMNNELINNLLIQF